MIDIKDKDINYRSNKFMELMTEIAQITGLVLCVDHGKDFRVFDIVQNQIVFIKIIEGTEVIKNKNEEPQFKYFNKEN